MGSQIELWLNFLSVLLEGISQPMGTSYQNSDLNSRQENISNNQSGQGSFLHNNEALPTYRDA